LHEYIPDWQKRYARNLSNLDELQDYFLKLDFLHKAQDRWHDGQLKALFGIDVFATTFPKDIGYKIYLDSPRTPLLLIRLENLNECARQAMRDFLGLEDFQIVNANVGEEKDYAELYKAFKEKPLPIDYVQSLYDTKFMRHFYKDAEIEKFMQKWTNV
jgi:hypothetical protein